jgi:hypothetical protein
MRLQTSTRRRHIPLGERLEAAEQVRSGRMDVLTAAMKLGVPPDEIERWVASRERPVTVAEVLTSPAELRLTRRAERLVSLIAAADAMIHALTGLLDAECKKFGRFTQQGSPP